MNDTQNTTTMKQCNSPERCHEILTSCLRELEEKTTDTSIILENLRSLIFFLQEFFVYTDFDPGSDNKEVRESSNIRIYHYAHYRNLFEVIADKIYTLDDKNKQMEQCIERAIYR